MKDGAHCAAEGRPDIQPLGWLEREIERWGAQSEIGARVASLLRGGDHGRRRR